MIDSGNGKPARYSVQMSALTKANLEQLRMQARKAGISKKFLAALGHILERLRDDPLNFGEPHYHLPALKLVVYQAVYDMIVVDFGVHEEKPQVFIRGFKLLS